jgi:hypothetical protein
VLPSDYAPALAAERDTHIQSILGRLADFVQAAPEERNMTAVSEAIRIFDCEVDELKLKFQHPPY